MRFHILGCGGAAGVPMISKGWGLCDPNNPKNRRMRTSALLETPNGNILIDTGPDLRQQLINANVRQISAILYTHEHADHTHGIDDIREINRINKKPIQIYGNQETMDLLKQRFSYAFDDFANEETVIFRPWLKQNVINEDDEINLCGLNIKAIGVNHGFLDALGFRFDDFAYITDAVKIYENGFKNLYGLKTLFLGCMTMQKHITHADLDLVLKWVEKLKPEMTYLTHMSAGMDYDKLCEILPDNIRPCYDGLVVNF
jgi:phosphoribosyl 1,2-cyclic phosphate phosphodiesterase